MTESISRRALLAKLSVVTAGSALKLAPLQAAQHAHDQVREEKTGEPCGEYSPRFFSPHQYLTLRSLCQTIIPPDEHSGGAIEAGAPEFIDLLTSENKDYQLKLGGGMMWLDAICRDRYGDVYLKCPATKQREILDLIAYRRNAETDPGLSQGISFFSFLRNLTTDGFYTSEIGIRDLQYIGNTYVAEFPGCPPVEEA
ncbi:MAG TPA: gluconate 2-dehydrogenase subunit 3 family protein [Terriglobia bacterium]|nr:gluconate 2-dehydrogenase subunit 3 family protein [Terriglobia bacterium]